MAEDTVFALATAPGRAALAIVRLSGPRVRFAVETLAGSCPPPRRASLRRLRDEAGAVIDEAIVLFLPAPASPTGEDVGELHIHGGRAVTVAVLDRLGALPGLRPARPGEFSRRAVENGRLDLTSAEGIADLVAAETSAQRRQAVAQAGGGLERAARDWRATLLRALALLEAEIDFPDEDDVPAQRQAVAAMLRELDGAIRSTLADAERGERLREGARIVIAGPANAGKSTLLNALAAREVAIVTPVAGTTRDLLDVALDLDGYPAVLTDTAGIRPTDDFVERIGVERARQAADGADIVLWLQPVDRPGETPPELGGATVVVVSSKADLGTAPDRTLPVSAATGEGLSTLRARLAELVGERLGGSEPALVTRARHREELATVLDEIAVVLAEPDLPIEFAAEHVRRAVGAIGRLTGAVDLDEVFDLIFSEFCIGK
jgi:tRNA modification GTPase